MNHRRSLYRKNPILPALFLAIGVVCAPVSAQEIDADAVGPTEPGVSSSNPVSRRRFPGSSNSGDFRTNYRFSDSTRFPAEDGISGVDSNAGQSANTNYGTRNYTSDDGFSHAQTQVRSMARFVNAQSNEFNTVSREPMTIMQLGSKYNPAELGRLQAELGSQSSMYSSHSHPKEFRTAPPVRQPVISTPTPTSINLGTIDQLRSKYSQDQIQFLQNAGLTEGLSGH